MSQTCEIISAVCAGAAELAIRPRNLAHYEAGTLTPEVVLTGRFERKHKAVDMDSVLREIEDTKLEEQGAAAAHAGLTATNTYLRYPNAVAITSGITFGSIGFTRCRSNPASFERCWSLSVP